MSSKCKKKKQISWCFFIFTAYYCQSKTAVPCTSPRQRMCSTRLPVGKGSWLEQPKSHEGAVEKFQGRTTDVKPLWHVGTQSKGLKAEEKSIYQHVLRWYLKRTHPF